MTVILLVSVFLLVTAWVYSQLSRPKKRHETDFALPYVAKQPLTPPEQVLYHRLVDALPEHIILAQVQLGSLLGIRKCADRIAWWNRISRMSADFVICSRGFMVIAVVELDDSTHQRKHRLAADRKKEAALASAEIPLMRWNVRDMPDVRTIRNAVLAVGKNAKAA